MRRRTNSEHSATRFGWHIYCQTVLHSFQTSLLYAISKGRWDYHSWPDHEVLGSNPARGGVLGKSCQLCLPSVYFVAASLYLSVFPFGVGGLMWIWLYQFLSSLISFQLMILWRLIAQSLSLLSFYLLDMTNIVQRYVNTNSYIKGTEYKEYKVMTFFVINI